jgi:hypothetical protein
MGCGMGMAILPSMSQVGYHHHGGCIIVIITSFNFDVGLEKRFLYIGLGDSENPTRWKSGLCTQRFARLRLQGFHRL